MHRLVLAVGLLATGAVGLYLSFLARKIDFQTSRVQVEGLSVSGQRLSAPRHYHEENDPVVQLRETLPVSYNRIEQLAGLLGGEGRGFVAIGLQL